MYIFIWEDVKNLTGRYHDGGGLVIVAESLDKARAAYLRDEGKTDCSALTVPPNRVITCADHESPSVFVFPDAGCC